MTNPTSNGAQMMSDDVRKPESDEDENWCVVPESEDDAYCETCYNTGWLDCYCGGDLCVCSNNGEYPCPKC